MTSDDEERNLRNGCMSIPTQLLYLGQEYQRLANLFVKLC